MFFNSYNPFFFNKKNLSNQLFSFIQLRGLLLSKLEKNTVFKYLKKTILFIIIFFFNTLLTMF